MSGPAVSSPARQAPRYRSARPYPTTVGCGGARSSPCPGWPLLSHSLSVAGRMMRGMSDMRAAGSVCCSASSCAAASGAYSMGTVTGAVCRCVSRRWTGRRRTPRYARGRQLGARGSSPVPALWRPRGRLVATTPWRKWLRVLTARWASPTSGGAARAQSDGARTSFVRAGE